MMMKEERRRFLLSPKMLNVINLGTWDSIILSSKEEWKIWQEEFQREERKERIDHLGR